MNKSNPSIPWNDKRVEALLRQEMSQHQFIIASHHKEMQSLRDSLNLCMARFNSLYEHNQQEVKDLISYFEHKITILKDKVSANEKYISDQKQTILSLYQQLQDFYVIFSRKDEIEKFKKDLESNLNDAIKNNLISLQEFQQQSKHAYKQVKDNVEKLKEETQENFSKFDDKFEHKFSISKIDRDGILKEIRAYHKATFIIEKKIENIYTLIERINKRNELCHKPEY